MDPVEPGAGIAPRDTPAACRVAMLSQPRVKTLQELLRRTTKISKAQVGYHVSSVCPNLFVVIVITGWLHPVIFRARLHKKKKNLFYPRQTLFVSMPICYFSCIASPSLIHGSGGTSPAIGTYRLTTYINFTSSNLCPIWVY